MRLLDNAHTFKSARELESVSAVPGENIAVALGYPSVEVSVASAQATDSETVHNVRALVCELPQNIPEP